MSTGMDAEQRVVELAEHASVPLPGAATGSLEKSRYRIPRASGLDLTLGPGGLELQAAGVVGIGGLSIPGPDGGPVRVLVAPKGARHLPRERRGLVLLRFGQLLALANNLDPDEVLPDVPGWSAASPGSQVLLMLGIPYERLIRELLHRDMRRHYMQEEQELTARVRGKLVVAQHARNVIRGRAHRMPCRYEEFTEDHWDNRILKAAMTALLRTSAELDRQSELPRLFGRHLRAFVDVAEIAGTRQEQRRARLHRVSTRYRDALVWAVQILNAIGERVSDGSGAGVWLETAPAFERLTELVFGRAINGCEELSFARQHSLGALLGSQCHCEPDLCIFEGKRAILIGDAKYKDIISEDVGNGSLESVWRAGVKSSDVFQLYAYLRRGGCATGMFVVPFWSEHGRAAELLPAMQLTPPPLDHGPGPLWVLGLNLLSNPRKVLAEGARHVREVIALR